jgi:predicted HTH domain antitoxin
MKSLVLELPQEVLDLLGSEEEARREAKMALVMDLVRRRRMSRAKAAEVLGLPLVDFAQLIAEYEIPWFDYSAEDLESDLQALRSKAARTQ